jgi:hypothetical protein
MPDEGELRQPLPDGQALGGLVAREDVVELLHAQRRAVTEEHAVLAEFVGQRLEPGHVRRLEHLRVLVEHVAGGVVVVRVVHAPGHCGIVVAEHGLRHGRAGEVARLVGAGPIAYGVAQADELVDALRLVGPEHRLQGLDIRMYVGEDAVAHRADTIASSIQPPREQRLEWAPWEGAQTLPRWSAPSKARRLPTRLLARCARLDWMQPTTRPARAEY